MSYLITNKQLDSFDFKFKELNIKLNSKNILIDISDDELIILEGFLYDLEQNKILNIKQVSELIKVLQDKPLPENITGQFNITYINNESIKLINDFVGMYPLYYSFEESIFITNNIYSFYDFDFKFDEISFFQSFVGRLYGPINNHTLFENVKQLRAGEYIFYDYSSKRTSIILDSTNIQNQKVTNYIIDETINKLKENASIFNQLSDNIVLGLSGGVDSRIVVSSFHNNTKNLKSFSYGEKDYIDNKIAKDLSDYLNINHQNISFIKSLFPTNEDFNNLLKYGKEYFLACWFSVIKHLKKDPKYDNSTIILGDLLDLLRNKNIKSLRSKSSRIKYQIKKAVGIDHKIESLNIDDFISNIQKLYKNRITELENSFPELFKKYNFDSKSFYKRTNSDIEDFIKFLVKKVNPKNQLNLEEAFYIFTWGSKTMGRQATVFKGDYKSYAFLANRHIVKFLLNISPLEKFEDTLTDKLLKNKNFNYYSHFPTSQIPLVPYNTNIYIKYMVWAFRNTVDQYRIKKGKGRLIKHIEWKKYYSDENKKALEELLSNVPEDLKYYPLDIFNKRATGESWPLGETDINVFTYLLKFRMFYKNN